MLYTKVKRQTKTVNAERRKVRKAVLRKSGLKFLIILSLPEHYVLLIFRYLAVIRINCCFCITNTFEKYLFAYINSK